MTTTRTDINVEALSHWGKVAPILVINNDADNERAIEHIAHLAGEVKGNKAHPFYTLLHTLITLVEAYEEKHHPLPAVSDVDMLAFLMEQHHLTQSDLPEIGSQTTVSLILSGKRQLTKRHIAALSKRFNVPASVFLD